MQEMNVTENQVDEFFDNLVKDNKELYWSRKAERGDIDACYRLGISQFNIDYEKSIYWLTKSANQGHVESYHSLGLAYYERCKNKEYYWIKKSADQGYADSIFHLNGRNYKSDGILKQNSTYLSLWNASKFDSKHNQHNLMLSLKNDFTYGVEIYGISFNRRCIIERFNTFKEAEQYSYEFFNNDQHDVKW